MTEKTGGPPSAPTKKVKALSTARRREDETLRRVIRNVLLGKTKEAEVILRDLNAAKEQLAKHKHGMQIGIVEQRFREYTGKEPWPKDIPPGMLMHFRGLIGMVLNSVKLARLLDDIKQANDQAKTGVKNLIYFLSTDSGKKSSRWEMLMVEAREEEYARNKALERAECLEGYTRLFGKTPLHPPVNGGKMVEPLWVTRQKAERDNLIALNKLGSSAPNYHDNKQRIADIERRLQHWEKTGR